MIRVLSMKQILLLLLIMMPAAVIAGEDQFIFHIGCHTPLHAATYAAAMVMTGNSDVNVNVPTLVSDNRLIMHAGYHNQMATAAYAAAAQVTGQEGLTISMDAEDANACFAAAGVAVLVVYCLRR
jgi:hypothetical protein